MSAGALTALLLAVLGGGMLVVALVRVVLLMRATDRDLVSVHFLLRAVADRVEPVPGQVRGIAENVRAIDEVLAQFCRHVPGASAPRPDPDPGPPTTPIVSGHAAARPPQGAR